MEQILAEVGLVCEMWRYKATLSTTYFRRTPKLLEPLDTQVYGSILGPVGDFLDSYFFFLEIRRLQLKLSIPNITCGSSLVLMNSSVEPFAMVNLRNWNLKKHTLWNTIQCVFLMLQLQC